MEITMWLTHTSWMAHTQAQSSREYQHLGVYNIKWSVPDIYLQNYLLGEKDPSRSWDKILKDRARFFISLLPALRVPQHGIGAHKCWKLKGLQRLQAMVQNWILLFHFPIILSCANYLESLNLSFLICKVDKCCYRKILMIKWTDIIKIVLYIAHCIIRSLVTLIISLIMGL